MNRTADNSLATYSADGRPYQYQTGALYSACVDCAQREDDADDYSGQTFLGVCSQMICTDPDAICQGCGRRIYRAAITHYERELARVA